MNRTENDRRHGTPINETWINRCPLVVGAGNHWKIALETRFFSRLETEDPNQQFFRGWIVAAIRTISSGVRLQAIVAAQTPRPSQKVLFGGLVSQSHDLDFLEKYADRRIINVFEPPAKPWLDMVDELGECERRPFEIGLAVLFAIQLLNHACWGRIAENPSYLDFSDRWTSPAHVAYCQALNDACRRNPHLEAQSAFNAVLDLLCDAYNRHS
jgi:hypothetical protein